MKYIKQNKWLKYHKEKSLLIRVLKNHDYLLNFKNDIRWLVSSSNYYSKMNVNGFIRYYSTETLLSWFVKNSVSLNGYNRSKIFYELKIELKKLCQGT